jgi:hypothetical protein
MSKNDITVIIPVHDLSGDNTMEYFNNAIKSVETQTEQPDALMIVVPEGSDTEKTLKDYDFGNLKDKTTIVFNPGKTDFQSQLNYGVNEIETEWFVFLEMDDELSDKWIENVVLYKSAHDDVEIFLPIVVDVDEQGNFMGLTNEAVWANSFSEELGVLDNSSLLSYENFNIDGFACKKSIFDDFGGLKSNVKLTFIYEFLLRVTFNDAKIMVIPRFGYKHVNQREGSLFKSYQGEINPVEAKWWLSQAKKEYYFKNEREITYSEN